MKANSPMSFMKARQKRTLKRTNSCPDWHEIEEIVAAKNKPIIEESKSKYSTDDKAGNKTGGKKYEEIESSEILFPFFLFVICDDFIFNHFAFIFLNIFFFQIQYFDKL